MGSHNIVRTSRKRDTTHIRNTAYLFLAPALLPILVFFFLPALAAFVLSFTDFDIYSLGDFRNARFVGLKNYLQLFDDPLFAKSMVNTFYYVLVGGPLSVAVSLGMALLLNSKLARFKGFFRTVYFAPVVTTLVAVAVVWRYLYHPRFGLLNYGLSLVGIDPIDWLGDPTWAMPAMILLSVWKSFGYNMIIFVAGLQSIPEELYEAARIDGANAWQQFTRVTAPMLLPTAFFVGIITMINNFQLFAEPYVMTQGGPLNSTLSVVLLMYQQGFRWWNMGYSAAIAFVLFAIILAGSLIQAAFQKRSALTT
ncbi:MAG: sugar ABC transporter permease [Ignavibacteriae bacterium]|nr:sugar ABC transporter permease [Ignavibacteriota bacterium]